MHLHGKAKVGRVILQLLLIPVISVLASNGCSTESRHRTILYDELWSNDAGVKNFACVPDLRAACEREARDGERDFSKTLSTIFHAAPECRTVDFRPLTADAVHAEPEYWRLRIDFRPRLERQPFELGPGTDRPRIGGDDAAHSADYICKAVKNNGVTAIW